MSTVYGDNYTKYYQTVPAEFVSPGIWNGPKRSWSETYTAASLASGSTIYCFRPPAGAKFSSGYLMSGALGTGVTLAVGTPDDTTKFLGATSHATAVRTELPSAAKIASVDYEFDGATDVVITTGGGTATGLITLVMDFKVA